jgi:hypothetical protein
MQQIVLGIDIGGANLKYASSCGTAAAREFAMWLTPELLSQSLLEDIQKHFIDHGTSPDELAVTMTGELADCFLDRKVGVEHIVHQTCQAAETLAIPSVRFYGVDGRFHQAKIACESPDLIAAANWHALANFVGREIASDALLIDIGSTTTDIIPISGQKVATDALTDYDRLCDGSLVYIGCRRTPVCGLVSNLEYRGISTPVMNEAFATMDDAMLLLGHTEEDASDCSSADGKPRSRVLAANRLARMIGLDRRTINVHDAKILAHQIIAAATEQIAHAIQQHHEHHTWVLSGHGQVLVSKPDGQPTLHLADHLGNEVARCAPAYAVARLKFSKTQ